MPKSCPTHTTSTSRRSLLSAAPAAMVLAGAGIGGAVQAAAPGPDAELIAHCARLDALEREFLATDFGARPGTAEGNHAEAEQDRLLAAQDPIVDAICNLPCTTHEGAIAVARSLALWDAEFFKRGGPDDYTNNRLIVALVCGLTGRAAA